MNQVSEDVRELLQYVAAQQEEKDVFRDAEHFVEQLLSASFRGEEFDASEEKKRAKLLDSLVRKFQSENSSGMINFYRFENSQTKPRSLFELLQKLADGLMTKTAKSGSKSKLPVPDWLLPSLKNVAADIAREDKSPSRGKSPARSPARSPQRSPRGSPTRSPRGSPARSPRKSRERSPPRRDGTPERSPRRETSRGRSPPRREASRERSPPRRETSHERSPPRRETSPPRRERTPERSPPRRERTPERSPPRRERSPRRSPPRNEKEDDGEEFQNFAEDILTRGWDNVAAGVSVGSQAGARVMQLTPAQRVALHFTTPGDASRETLIQFVKMIEPVESQLNELWDVSQIRDYAYDLWLAQTDVDLYTLADDLSGGQGVIHPTIQQELEDAVRRYQTQYEDVIASGKRAIRNLETQVDTLKTKEQQTKLKSCIEEIKQTIEPDTQKVACTKIPADSVLTDQEVRALPSSKWLSYLGLNPEASSVKFLSSMTSQQLENFGNYLVSQSAIGICRVSHVLQEMSDSLQQLYQNAKDDPNVPIPDINNLETLRFLEWVMRRPLSSVNMHDAMVTWLLRYPYIQGKVDGVFKRRNEKKGVPIHLSSKYAVFAPKSQDEQVLSAIFALTNKGNIDIMKDATESDVFRNVL